MSNYPKRLIEVDLPIKKISVNARQEKEMRRSHVPLLYIWPATRPPASCRAVICAALWPDPGDINCPKLFIEAAAIIMKEFRDKRGGKPRDFNNSVELRKALLDFIADFSAWENSTAEDYLETSIKLTRKAHEALNGVPDSKPFICDPFAGGGAIPLEGLRVGADVFSSDSNAVAAFYNKIILEFIPRHGTEIIEALELWASWIQQRIKEELSEFYPKGDDNSIPIVYLWARTITCEGPRCGVEIPLLRNTILTRKGDVILQLLPSPKGTAIDFNIILNPNKSIKSEGTVKRGAAICPCCGYTNPIASVRRQLKERAGGTNDARMYCVVSIKNDSKGRYYRLPSEKDVNAFKKAEQKLKEYQTLNLIPDDPLPIPMEGKSGTLGINLQGYGIKKWRDLFHHRQTLSHATYIKLSREYLETIENNDFRNILAAIISLVINRLIDLNASLCTWQLNTPNADHVFKRWALSMIMDYGEINPLSGAGGSQKSIMKRILPGLNNIGLGIKHPGNVQMASATNIPLPDDSVDVFITDPPYYDAIPYADLFDYFYVWMKKLLANYYKDMFRNDLTDKMNECIMDINKGKDKLYFEQNMERAMSEGRRILRPNGICVLIFAHKSTSGWEAQLQAMLNAGWTITASWPIDTEMGSRSRAQNSAALASSVHLVCRPRENPDGSLRTDEVGDWRDVLAELPKRIHEWMPRLAEEGVVGADAIFACLGPALEIFSRYSRVEKASGEVVPLKEYLEHVWAAVAKEALNMIFEGAETTGFEEDARLTAMWLWTLSAGATDGNGDSAADDESEETDDDEDKPSSKAKVSGYTLEYDAARKIAQGLGAHLERLQSLVEIKGDKARLLPVSERTRALFGKDEADTPKAKKKKKEQLSMFDEIEEAEESGSWGAKNVPQLGNTTLDRLHQSMILFAAGRGEALKRFLVDEGVGRDERFWRLAQAFSALYPKNTDEKRWVDGMLARKKGLGL